MDQHHHLAPALDADARARIAELSWYHTIDVAPGVTTPGWFDLRHAVDALPWPDVTGKRCLDVGTWDGFYAWELARRGAAEVVAIDVPDVTQIDYPPEIREQGLPAPGSQARPAGFRLLRELADTDVVTWRGGNVYDLDPDAVGRFDVVVVGSLLLHLRDPVRALDAVRRVTSGQLLSVDFVHPHLELLSRVLGRRPLFELRGVGADFEWWRASSPGLAHLLTVSGFRIEAWSPRFLLRHGPGARGVPRPAGTSVRRILNVALAREPGDGHLHRAFLAAPRW